MSKPVKNCETCGTEYTPKSRSSRFCSRTCLWKANSERVPHNKGTSKGWVDSRGYRWLYVRENGKQVARREHRVLMELHIGRKLEPWELVHHRDENPSNNSIENLEIVEWGKHTAEHHKGSRKSQDTRRTLEAFALMREELARERKIKSELLEALEYALPYLRACVPNPRNGVNADCSVDVNCVDRARAAIAKATGGDV